MDNKEYFVKLCRDGLLRRYGADVPEDIRARLDYEISIIDRMGYINYYLIVFDFINYAKSQGIPVGPGRGSGCLLYTSVGYLTTLPESERRSHIHTLFAAKPPALIVTRNLSVFDEVLEFASQYEVPVLRSTENTSSLMSALISNLSVEVAPQMCIRDSHGKAQIEQSGLVDHAVPDDDARAAGDQLCSAAGPHTQRGQEYFRCDNDEHGNHASDERELRRFN